MSESFYSEKESVLEKSLDFIPEVKFLLECDVEYVNQLDLIGDICRLRMEGYKQLKYRLVREISELKPGPDVKLRELKVFKEGRAPERLIEWVLHMISVIQHGARIKFYEDEAFDFLTLSRLFLAKMPCFFYHFRTKILEIYAPKEG